MIIFGCCVVPMHGRWLNHSNNVLVCNELVQGRRSIFLDPGQQSRGLFSFISHHHHVHGGVPPILGLDLVPNGLNWYQLEPQTSDEEVPVESLQGLHDCLGVWNLGYPTAVGFFGVRRLEAALFGTLGDSIAQVTLGTPNCSEN